MTAVDTTVTIEAPATSVATLDPTAVTKPLVDATHTMYEKVAGGFEWYFEHWVDIVEEIRAEQAARVPNLAVDDILTALGDARVASDIPGRVRLRLPELKHQTSLAEQCAETLKGIPGIDEVHVSPVTGSVLAYYDTDILASVPALLAAVKPAR